MASGIRMTASPFSPARFQALCRLAAYALLFEYALLFVSGLFPLNTDAQNLLGLVGSSLDTASLPMLAVPLLFAGFSRSVRPARWEWRFARALRSLLLLVSTLYLLLVPATIALGVRIQHTADQQMRLQQQFAQRQIQAFSKELAKAPTSQDLRRLLESQPQLRATLAGPESPLAASYPDLSQQRAQSLRLTDRISTNLSQQYLQQRSNSAGELFKQGLRFCLLALAHCLFFGLASLLWPSRLPSLTLAVSEDDEV